MTLPAEYWSDDSLSLGDCFERAAAVHGSRPALVSERWSASYRELDAVTNRVANGIRARGSSTGDRVAVLMPHDTLAIAAIVAVAKAGCILVYLNPVHAAGAASRAA